MVEEKGKQPWTLREVGGKTLWDWLQLLIVPAVLSLITVGFALWQDTRQEQVENARINQAQKIEDQRAEAERELAAQRAQDEALQAYLDQMSHLLLEKDLRGSKEGSAVRTLARARTFAVMPRLDAERNQTIVRFLGESKLIAPDDAATISLLRGASLRHADIEGADLRGADLRGADLRGADLKGADLQSADLRDAAMNNVNLRGASLFRANLQGASLYKANLEFSALVETDLSGFTDLTKANLSGALLIGANLSGAYMNNANLENAKELTDDQLRAARSLKHATMPDGQTLRGDKTPDGPTFEDWLKDKEGSGKDVENE